MRSTINIFDIPVYMVPNIQKNYKNNLVAYMILKLKHNC